MTVFEYLRKNPVWSIVMIGIAGAMALYVGASYATPKHEANFSLTVDHRELQAPEDYAFDGYYALRATEIFTDTVVSWFRTPAVLDGIRRAAAEAHEGPLPEELGFRVKKFAGQNVVVTLSDTDPDRARVLAEAAIEVTTDMAGELNRRSDGDSLFVLKASEPLIEERRFPPGRAGLIGLALGLALGAALVFLATPPKKEKDPVA